MLIKVENDLFINIEDLLLIQVNETYNFWGITEYSISISLRDQVFILKRKTKDETLALAEKIASLANDAVKSKVQPADLQSTYYPETCCSIAEKTEDGGCYGIYTNGGALAAACTYCEKQVEFCDRALHIMESCMGQMLPTRDNTTPRIMNPHCISCEAYFDHQQVSTKEERGAIA